MKLKIIINVIIILLFTGCKKEYPELSFETKTINIGNVKHDTIINVSYKFRNTGKSVLKIEKVTSDCHCTVAEDFQKIIKPNGEGEIKVKYHSKGYGYFEQLIEVFSNDKNDNSLLILSGAVLMDGLNKDK